MKQLFSSERFIIEEVAEASRNAKVVSRGLSIGEVIRMTRMQLGMSQLILAKRASVPQSTISRIEKGKTDANLSTLNKILSAMFCDLLVLPVLSKSIETIRINQAKRRAEERMKYLKGTMSLEEQKPDANFLAALFKEEVSRLLQGSDEELWRE